MDHKMTGIDGIPHLIDCDRTHFFEVLTEMLRLKLEQLRDKDITEFRLLKAMVPYILHRLGNGRHEQRVPQPQTVPKFLGEYCFSAATDNQQRIPARGDNMKRKQQNKWAGDVVGLTPVSYAAMSGNVEILAQLLVIPGVEVSPRLRRTLRCQRYVVFSGSTPFLLAAEFNFEETAPAVLALLMDHGADPLGTDNAGNGAILKMASTGQVESIRWLKRAVPRLDLDRRYGVIRTTALMRAVVHGHPGTVDALLGLGADCRHDGVNALGMNPLVGAGMCADAALVRTLTRAVGAEHMNRRVALGAWSLRSPFPALALAERVRGRIRGMAQLDPRDVRGMASIQGATPLHFAVAYYNLAALRAMLELGADPLVRNAMGMTPFDLLQAMGGCPPMEVALLWYTQQQEQWRRLRRRQQAEKAEPESEPEAASQIQTPGSDSQTAKGRRPWLYPLQLRARATKPNAKVYMLTD
jgi:hypothetical protein